MEKPDYSDLDAAESIGHIFGFIAPVIAIVGLLIWAVIDLLG